jgi:hypothetical protein
MQQASRLYKLCSEFHVSVICNDSSLQQKSTKLNVKNLPPSMTGLLPVNFKYVVLIIYKLLFIVPPFIIVNVYIYCLYVYVQ